MNKQPKKTGTEYTGVNDQLLAKGLPKHVKETPGKQIDVSTTSDGQVHRNSTSTTANLDGSTSSTTMPDIHNTTDTSTLSTISSTTITSLLKISTSSPMEVTTFPEDFIPL